MKRRQIALLLSISMLLTGCSWLNGSYVYIEPHVEQSAGVQSGTIQASNYQELMAVMEDMVLSGRESGVIDIGDYTRGNAEVGMSTVCRFILGAFPIGAYAVEDISYEIGSNNGRPAVAVTIQYRRTRMEIQRIRKKKDMEGIKDSIYTALDDHAARVVVLVEAYEETDYSQIVQDYAREHPHTVMEIPQVSEGIYGNGSSRVVELNFAYQNSRESLRQMQTLVRPVFEAAALYVSGDGSDQQKLTQLFSFLTERYDYQIDTSITPAYSLLCHGVGDSRAFAEVYAQMCRRADLECRIVTGTRDGEPWTWNMVADNGNYFHVDLLRSSGEGAFREYTDEEMTGYVWDYSAYPACVEVYQPPLETDVTETDTVPEQPEESTEPETEPSAPETEPETP